MKKIYSLLSLMAITLTPMTYAQTQIENGGFETWENEGDDDQEPTQWSSLKTSTDDSWLNLANQAPQVIWKEAGAHGGSSCLRLKVAAYNALVGLSPNATVTNGRVYASTTPSDAYVYTETSDAKWNSPITVKPDSIVGWYKYAPQGGDKGKVEVLFHNNSATGILPHNGTTSHHIGTGKIEFTTAKSSWTRFSTPINYTSANAPTHFLIVSTAGDELNAVTGTELYLDDLSFIYNPVVEPTSIAEIEIPFTIFGANDMVKLDILYNYTQGQLALYSLDGKEVWKTNSIDNNNSYSPELNQGIYVYQLMIDNVMYSGKISLN